MNRQERKETGRWLLVVLCFVSLVAAVIFAPDTLPLFKQRLLAIVAALLAGTAAYFMTGRFQLELRTEWLRLGKGQISATSGIGVFVIVLVWWLGPSSPLDGRVIQFIERQILEREADVAPYSDQYVAVALPSRFRGPFCNPDRYDVNCELTNNQDRPLLVTGIEAFFISRDVFDRVPVYNEISDRGDFVYYISELAAPEVFAARAHKVIPLRGPLFIPQELLLRIHHSGASSVSECRFQVSQQKDVENTLPRQLTQMDALDVGVDGLSALRAALPLLRQIGPDAKLVSCLPLSHTTLITPNGLYVHRFAGWAVFCATATSYGVVAVDSSGVRHQRLAMPDMSSLERRVDATRVRIGIVEALRKASDLLLIYGNSDQEFALLVGKDERGRQLPIWRLPYIGPDYLNILVDAESGEILPSISYWRDLCPIETRSRTTPAEPDTQGIEGM